jgi:hypothetical protein
MEACALVLTAPLAGCRCQDPEVAANDIEKHLHDRSIMRFHEVTRRLLASPRQTVDAARRYCLQEHILEVVAVLGSAINEEHFSLNMLLLEVCCQCGFAL